MNNRQAFVEKLMQLAEKDPTVCLVVMDVGFSYIEEFQKKFPKQFYNFGVTEQASMGIVAGMALAGLKPWIYSMVPFVLMRPFEQLRNDVMYHNANVKVVGVQGKESYKFLGFSHNVTEREEQGLIDSLGIQAFYPQNPSHVANIVQDMYDHQGPEYLRL